MWRNVASLVVVGIAGLLVSQGCGVKSAREAGRYDSPASVPAEAVVADGLQADSGKRGVTGGLRFVSTATSLDRKIIYSANIELAVEDFSGVPDRVISLVKEYDAYVADSTLSGSTGENRRGIWTIRVPVARFEDFVNAAKGLGELVKVATSSRDVSEEYYDVDARIRNKTKEDERLLKLLEERPGKLEDVIAIERELSRVREELERMQGRMRVLQDLTSLTTVELTIVEIRDYEPPQAPTLATRIRRTFLASISALRMAGEAALLAAVGITPWLPVGLVVLAPVYWIARRRSARERERPTIVKQ